MAIKQRRARVVTSRNVKTDSSAFRSVASFGGLQRFCDATGIAPGTVHGWLVTGTIPKWRHDHIIAAAQRAEIAFDPAWLQAVA